MLRAEIVAEGIVSQWTEIEITTSGFTTDVVDVFKDGSGVALYKFEGNLNDESGCIMPLLLKQLNME